MKNRNDLIFKDAWVQLDLVEYYSYYWEYQYQLGKEYIVPFFRSKGFFLDGYNVCEIGSAEGGVLFAFAENGAKFCLGTDIATNRIIAGSKIAEYFNQQIEFSQHDILKDDIPIDWQKKFHIVILRDVIEHLDEPKKALEQISKMLAENGLVYITFPPYPSPYGGHQHLLRNFWGRFPFIHLLPYSLFTFIVGNGRQSDVEEVLRLKRNNFSLEKFFTAVEESDFKICYEKYYLIRPVYKIKFGLPTIPLPYFINSNALRNIFSTEAEIILMKK